MASLDVIRPLHQPLPKGSIKKQLREEKVIGTMGSLSIIGYLCYRHRLFLTSLALVLSLAVNVLQTIHK